MAPDMASKAAASVAEEERDLSVFQRPDSFGRFGKFGGKYVPETLMYALSELETAFRSLSSDHDFQVYIHFLYSLSMAIFFVDLMDWILLFNCLLNDTDVPTHC